MVRHCVLIVLACFVGKSEQKVRFSKLSHVFGLEATIEHNNNPIDALANPRVRRSLQKAFDDSYGLVLVRWLPPLERRLTKDEILALCEVFGTLEAESAVDGSFERVVENDPRIHEFSVAPSSHAKVNSVQFNGLTPTWHTDQSFRTPRPDASLLYCRSTPSNGDGQTLFASTVAAARSLDFRVLRYLQTKAIARHSYAALMANLQILQNVNSSQAGTLTGNSDRFTEIPLYDGYALDLAPHVIDKVSGLDSTQSKRLVHALAYFATAPRFVYLHTWRVDDALLWSNHRTMHAATPVTEGQQRLMWRATFNHMKAVESAGNEVLENLVVNDDDDDQPSFSSCSVSAYDGDVENLQLENLISYLTKLGSEKNELAAPSFMKIN